MTSRDIETDLLHSLRHENKEDLQTDIWFEENVWIFRPLGRIDTGTSQDLDVVLTEGINQGMRFIVLDLSSVPIITSSGLRVIIKAGKRLKAENGELVLSSPREYVSQVLGMSGFTRIFRIVPTNKTAIVSLVEKPG